MSSLPRPVYRTSRKHPDNLALAQGIRSVTFIQLEKLVVTKTRRLLSLGIKKEERVAILARNSIDYIAMILAASRIGVSVVPLNLLMSPTEWRSIVRRAGCRVLFTDLEHQSSAESLGINLLLFDEQDNEAEFSQSDLEIPTQLSTDAETTLVFTSGSSGNPKGVILSYGNHYYSALGSNLNIPLQFGDCWLLSLPLYHVGGLSIVYRSLLAGSAVLVERRFDAGQVNELVESGRVTHLSLVPTMLKTLINTRGSQPFPRSLKAVLLGGAPVSPELVEQINEFSIPALITYGMTETASQVTTTAPGDKREKRLTSGRLLKYRQLKVVDRSGNELPPGQIGEIVVGGEILFKGYLDDKDCFIKDDNHFLFHTGDIGCLDDEGYLLVKGRSEEMFISGGENIFPAEIKLIVEELTGIDSCAVIAVDNSKWDKRPVLFVESSKQHGLDEATVRDYLSLKLAKIKQPDKIILIDHLPRTSIGKIDNCALGKLYEKLLAGGDI